MPGFVMDLLQNHVLTRSIWFDFMEFEFDQYFISVIRMRRISTNFSNITAVLKVDCRKS